MATTMTQMDPKTDLKSGPPSLDTSTIVILGNQNATPPYSHAALMPVLPVENATPLTDQNSRGKERPWRKWKLASMRAANALVGWHNQPHMEAWGDRIKECGSWLQFGMCPDGDGHWLQQANFCNVKVCPLCMWRRSKKLTSQVMDVAHAVQIAQPVRFLLLTVTLRNVEAGFSSAEADRPEAAAKRLSDAMDQLLMGFDRMTRQSFPRWKPGKWRKDGTRLEADILGYYRTLEITRNLDEDAWRNESKWYGSYHPHLHVLLVVRPSYFTRGYISQKKWTTQWKKAAKLDYDPIIDIRPLRPKGKPDGDPRKLDEQEVLSGVLETAKYLTKPHFLAPDKADAVATQTQRTLSLAVYGRKLTGWGGIMAETKKALALDEAESDDADLVHVDSTNTTCQCPTCGSDLAEEVYRWHGGQRDFFRHSLTAPKAIEENPC